MEASRDEAQEQPSDAGQQRHARTDRCRHRLHHLSDAGPRDADPDGSVSPSQTVATQDAVPPGLAPARRRNCRLICSSVVSLLGCFRPCPTSIKQSNPSRNSPPRCRLPSMTPPGLARGHLDSPRCFRVNFHLRPPRTRPRRCGARDADPVECSAR